MEPALPVDVLTITVPIVGRYPSVNHIGRDGLSKGRKSPAYRRLYDTVLKAAREAIAACRWESVPRDEDAFVVATRYCPDRRRLDRWNIGKCEADALTEAGVWEDDCVAEPYLRRFHDPAGPDRVAFVVMRGRRIDRSVERSRRARQARTEEPQTHRPYRGGPIPDGYAVLGRELVPLREARKLLC